MNDIYFGLNIALIGMSLVFALLILLWGLLALLGRLDRAPERAEEAPGRVTTAAAQQAGLSEDELAAITIAVIAHAAARRRQAAPAMRSAWPGSQMYASRWLAAGRTRQTLGWSRKR